MKKTFLLFQILILLAATFLGLEFMSYFSLSKAERAMPAAQLMEKLHNQYLKDFSLKNGCSFAETIISHPMLGFVHRQKEFLPSRCQKNIPVNNIGMISKKNLPLVKSPSEFSVLIVGGSVAQQFASYNVDNEVNYFEKYLNDHFVSPNHKPFRIYNGALGAWSMPNQLNMLLMYGERLDGIIALDGYNEGFALQEGRRLEQVPAATYILANSSVKSFRHLGLNFIWAYQYLLSHTFLKHSYFCNVVYKLFVAFYQRHFVPSDLIEEFTSGNSESLAMGELEAKEWSLSSLERYMEHFHKLAMMNNIKSAQFLQPSRLMGKTLTAEEKMHEEFIAKETYLKLDQLYQKLARKKFPVADLSEIFKDRKERIYADHIHYLTMNGRSVGNEIVAEKMAQALAKFWGLKRKKE